MPADFAVRSARSLFVALCILILAFMRLAAQKKETSVERLDRQVILAASIRASRVYLGVHWPSDVLGGWIAGTSWALGWLSVFRRWELKA